MPYTRKSSRDPPPQILGIVNGGALVSERGDLNASLTLGNPLHRFEGSERSTEVRVTLHLRGQNRRNYDGDLSQRARSEENRITHRVVGLGYTGTMSHSWIYRAHQNVDTLPPEHQSILHLHNRSTD